MILKAVPLAPSFKKSEFTCGKAALDTYLHTKAKQDVKNLLAQIFVLPDGDLIMGYYTLSTASIIRDIIPEDILAKVGKYTMFPVTLLGRLAVDKRYRGRRLGELLLIDALARAYLTTSMVASFAVVVDPIDDEAISFYRKYGFIMLDSGRMFLPMSTVGKVVDSILKGATIEIKGPN